jgi:predicted dehydrogenase
VGRRIALIELDTSHPEAFVPLLRELGQEVTAVLDSGGVRPPSYAGEFAKRHGIPTVATNLEDLPADVAMLLGCDWDLRYEQACTLLDAGMAVLDRKSVV